MFDLNTIRRLNDRHVEKERIGDLIAAQDWANCIYKGNVEGSEEAEDEYTYGIVQKENR